MASLHELLQNVDILDGEVPALDIAEVRDDSRRVQPGDLFVALRGRTVDGHAFLDDVKRRGAVAAVIEDPRARFDGPCLRVRSTACALGLIAANRHGRPAAAMRLLGVTGTNGKTTTSYLVEAILREAGLQVGLIGTVAYRSPAGSRPAPFTTPTPLELHATLAEMRDAGCSDVVMECSSHALAQRRMEGLAFAIAGFTNLTQDHLDLHGTMSAYAIEKSRLFSEHLRSDGTAVICIDGPYGQHMAAASRARVLHVGVERGQVRVRAARPVATGTEVELVTPAGGVAFTSPLVGGFNLQNLVVATGMALTADVSTEIIARALGSAVGAPGRLERVGDGEIAAYVDYAHTPDALERALAALRPSARGRLWVVFGCGGDRDRGKRSQMGRIAEAGADVAIVTSDNPRSEPPRAIIDEILSGMGGAPLEEAALADATRGLAVVEDRRRAIGAALAAAAPGDVILVAGKGHEDYQIVGKERLHFDDREEVALALQRRAKPG